jgi:cobalt-zinc-cadmium resistance protein CzcA
MLRIDFALNSDSASVEQNPFLGYIKQQVEVSQIAKKLERSQMLPDLNVGYFSQTIIGTQDVNGTPRNFGKDSRFTGVQAGISVPLWFSPYTSRAKAAKINETIARTNAENYSKSISGNYQSLLDEYNKYGSSVDYYEKQAVPEADLIIEQATRSYKAGALDYLNYVLTLNRALAIRQNYLDALNNFNQTIISIEYITGKIF